MSIEPPSLAYASHANPAGTQFWTALRIATVVWSAAIVVRHGTYWSTLGVIGSGTLTSFGLALAEIAILLAMLALALATPVPNASRLRALMALGCAVIALSAIGYTVDVSKLSPALTPEKIGRLVWMAATRVQVLAMPIALIVATAAMRRKTW